LQPGAFLGTFVPVSRLIALVSDRYRTVLVEKLRGNRRRSPQERGASVPVPQNIINLMNALKRLEEN
jgi:hypothetical protein